MWSVGYYCPTDRGFDARKKARELLDEEGGKKCLSPKINKFMTTTTRRLKIEVEFFAKEIED